MMPYARTTVEGEDFAKFEACMRFNSKNGKKNAEYLADPLDLEVHRPSIKNMAYVVRGPHRKTLVKITEIVREKNAIIGFKAKRSPFTGRAPTIFAKVNEVTKVEELPAEEKVEKAHAIVYVDDVDNNPTLIPFKRICPNY